MKKKPVSRFEAKLDLLVKATFKKQRCEIGGHYTMLTRGQLPVSKWELARTWGWSREKVNRFFKALAKDKGEPWAIEEKTFKPSVNNPQKKPVALGTIVTFINFEKLVSEVENDENGGYTL